MHTHVTRRLALGGLLTLASMGAAACGSSGGGGGAPAIPTVADGAPGTSPDASEPGGAGGQPADAPTDPSEAALLFDRCMAGRGFDTDMAGDVATGPQVIDVGGGAVSAEGGGGEPPSEVLVGPGGIEIDPDERDEFHDAMQRCDDHLSNMEGFGDEMSAEDRAALEDAMLEVRQCMEDKGFDVQFSVGSASEPNVVQIGGSLPPSAAPPELTEEDREALSAATKECTDEVFAKYPDLDAPSMPGGGA